LPKLSDERLAAVEIRHTLIGFLTDYAEHMYCGYRHYQPTTTTHPGRWLEPIIGSPCGNMGSPRPATL
jgi:hypothetical protein